MERLCPHCGEGLLKPLGNEGRFLECQQCRRSVDLRRLEAEEAEEERKRLEGDIRQMLREDEQKGCEGGSSDAKGSRKKQKKFARGQDPTPVHPKHVNQPNLPTPRPVKKHRLSIRPTPLLLEICERHGLDRTCLCDAYRAAISGLFSDT